MENFRKELEQLINKCSLENESDTPDFILAEYLTDCLKAFDKAVFNRETWYGRPPVQKNEELEEPINQTTQDYYDACENGFTGSYDDYLDTLNPFSS